MSPDCSSRDSGSILVTGASGFVGHHVLCRLREAYPAFTLYDLSNAPALLEGVEHVQCDAETFDFGALERHSFDYVIHLLAFSNNAYCHDLAHAMTVNVDFTRRLLDYCAAQPGLRKVIHLSSIVAYDNKNEPPVAEDAPLAFFYSHYSLTKGFSDILARYYEEKNGLPIVTVRLSNIYGPHQNPIDSPFLVPSKIVQGLTTGRIEVFSLAPERDWIYAPDAADAIVKLLDADVGGAVNLASGFGISVEEIVSEIGSQLGVPFRSLDKPTTGPGKFYCDISKIRQCIDWRPTTSLANGIADTIAYVRSVI